MRQCAQAKVKNLAWGAKAIEIVFSTFASNPSYKKFQLLSNDLKNPNTYLF